MAEGDKVIQECFNENFSIRSIIATDDWLKNNNDKINKSTEVIEASPDGLKKITSFSTPPEVIAILDMPESIFIPALLKEELVLGYEFIQDPGNFGTIIRTADWFGIKTIICSEDSVDQYNPKVIQSTMGSFTRVKVFYKNLNQVIKDTEANVWGTFLKGKNIYEEDLDKTGLVIFGNEGKGISPGLEKEIKRKLFIPGFSDRLPESLNVSTATAVVCSEFRRRG